MPLGDITVSIIQMKKLRLWEVTTVWRRVQGALTVWGWAPRLAVWRRARGETQSGNRGPLSKAGPGRPSYAWSKAVEVEAGSRNQLKLGNEEGEVQEDN